MALVLWQKLRGPLLPQRHHNQTICEGNWMAMYTLNNNVRTQTDLIGSKDTYPTWGWINFTRDHFLSKKQLLLSFWTFIASWGGNWMWRDITNSGRPNEDMQWVADGMTSGTLIIWTTGGSYGRKRAADLSGVGWIIFCKATGQHITGSFWENHQLQAHSERKCLAYACSTFSLK